MKKILNIAWKDLLVTLSDPAAIVLTLVTPFALTLVVIFAFSGTDDAGFTEIPVAVVDLDESELSQALVDVFESDDLADLIEPTFVDDVETARQGVDNEEFSAAVLIPNDLGNRLTPRNFFPDGSEHNPEPEEAVIEIYANPTRPTSANMA